ncbi:MAG: YdcH family protein [Magnetospirillum sp.]|nr:YdcH family protein [Magnetospirillum sp.]
MSLQDRIESLKAKHAALESAIEIESRRVLPDSIRIRNMKFEKLRIKDELTSMGAKTAH